MVSGLNMRANLTIFKITKCHVYIADTSRLLPNFDELKFPTPRGCQPDEGPASLGDKNILKEAGPSSGHHSRLGASKTENFWYLHIRSHKRNHRTDIAEFDSDRDKILPTSASTFPAETVAFHGASNHCSRKST
jgi:hypothetical protein